MTTAVWAVSQFRRGLLPGSDQRGFLFSLIVHASLNEVNWWKEPMKQILLDWGSKNRGRNKFYTSRRRRVKIDVSDKLLGNSKLTCKWQTCAVYNRNWVLKFCGGHIYIHAVHVAISHCIFVRQHLRALNFRRPLNTPPKKYLMLTMGYLS